ncbi:MAG TPA: SCO6880 family protein, partial [Acidimicrobiales bacterium]|nr:SCO6880 family protein [Acidimicrobiales bacterium]
MTERRYLFSPLERRGVVAGLRAGQLAVLAGGLAVAVAAMRAAPTAVGLGVAVGVVATALGVAFVDVGDRPVEQWLPVVARHLALRVATRHRTRPSGPARPIDRPRGRGGGGCHDVLPVPSPLQSVVIDELPAGPGTAPVATVSDRAAGTLGAVVAVRGHAFALLDSDEKERRLSAWADVLASLARQSGPVCRLQWVERTVAGDADALSRYLGERRVVDQDASPARSYAELVAEAGPLTQEHECYVALTVTQRAGPDVLQRELRLLEGQLRGADLDVAGCLCRRDLAAVVRTAFDLRARIALARRAAAHPDLAGAEVGSAWPAATETGWSTYRTDDTWHATFWVSEWPRTEVGPDFLGPLLLRGAGHRTVALTMAPTSPAKGFRQAEAARTAAVADEELRRRAGFLGTARQRREAEGLARREAELADGHAAYR